MQDLSEELRHEKAVSREDLVRPQYHIGFKAPVGLVSHKPVHESISLAALIQSDQHWPQDISYDTLSLEQWEYIRGLVWPDDPSSYLFLESQVNNHVFDNGKRWYEEYQTGYKYGMTKRAHFGDLQFLNSMASADGEPAQTTKDNLMFWLEVLYKLACGNQGVTAADKLDATFKGQFDELTAPEGSATLRDLLLGRTTGYRFARIPVRALGVCMHIISDSYAVGHTQRELLNPDDLAPRDPSGYIQFKDGTTPHFGAILAFHTYTGQDESRHTHYDELIYGLPNPNDINSFDSIFGAKDAIGKLTQFLNFYTARAAWEEGGVRKFLADEVFALHKNVQPGNKNVDDGIYLRQPISLCGSENKFASQPYERLYESTLAEKDRRLEEGHVGHGDVVQACGNNPALIPAQKRFLAIIRQILLCFACFVIAMILGIIAPQIWSARLL